MVWWKTRKVIKTVNLITIEDTKDDQKEMSDVLKKSKNIINEKRISFKQMKNKGLVTIKIFLNSRI